MKKIAVALGILIALIGSIPAQASGYSSAIWSPSVETYCLPIVSSSGAIETYKSWLSRMNVPTRSFCKVVDTTPLKSYQFLAGKAKDKNTGASLSEFDKRIKSCIGNDTSSLNPMNWGKVLSCNFKVAFFPTSKIMQNSFTNLKDTFVSHQPTAYVAVGFKTIKNISTNWGGQACSATNNIGFDIKLPSLITPLEFNIPCQPVKPLRALRALAVSALWIGFAFWIYFIAIKWWGKRAAA